MRGRTKTIVSGKGYRIVKKRSKKGSRLSILLNPAEIKLREWSNVDKICSHFDLTDHGTQNSFNWSHKSLEEAKELISLAKLKGLL